MPRFFTKQSKKPVPRRRTEPKTSTGERRVEAGDQKSFRRNRTLTGSASSQVVSSVERNSQLQSPRVEAHRLVDRRRRVSGLLIIFLGAAVMLSILVSQFTAGVVVRIKDMPSVVADQSYATAIDEYYGQRPIERFRFMLNKTAFTEFMQTQAPEIAQAQVAGLVGFATSAVTLEVRQPVSGWNIDGSKQYVDSSGTAFSRNYYETPGVKIIDNSGVPIEAGAPVASNRFLGFVGRLVGLVSQRGYTVTQVVIPFDTTRQVELSIKDLPYPIKCSIDRPAGEQAEDMDRAIIHLKGRGATPKYLDVRVSGKAFYR